VKVDQPGAGEKIEINLMNQEPNARLKNMRGAPRCGAKTRAGGQCQCPAIRGRKRCRIHGGRSTGAPHGDGNGNYKNGYWTAEAVEDRRWTKEMLQVYAKATEK
jgi:hypothetical protein